MGKQTKDFRQASLDYVDGDPEGAQKIVAQVGYEMGCEYGYRYAVDKACEWMRTHFGAPVGIPQAKSYNDAMRELITEFRKAMED